MSKQKPVDAPVAMVPIEKPTVMVTLSPESIPIRADMPPICTWPLTTIEGRARLHQMLAGVTKVLWDECEHSPIDIVVTDLAVSFSSFEPEDRPGEIVEGPMYYLVGPNGGFHTSSDGVYKSIAQLMMIEGRPPWTPAVILRAERCPTRNRKMRLSLALIGRAD